MGTLTKDIREEDMLCAKCECSFYFVRSIVYYSTTLLAGVMVGLLVASVVMKYQMSLLQHELNLLKEELDLQQRMTHDCEVDLKSSELFQVREQLEQLRREREGLLLEVDIFKQLIVNMEAKIQRTQLQSG